MKIAIKNICGLMIDEVAGRLELLGAPALLFDEALRTVEKSQDAVVMTSHIRRGVKLNRFIPEEHIGVLLSMQWGETFVTEIRSETEKCRATVICGNGWYLAVLQPLMSGLRERVCEKYIKMSGYDTSLRERMLCVKEASLYSRKHKTLFDIGEQILSELEVSKGLPFFDAVKISKSVVNEIARNSQTISERIEFSHDEEKLIAEGNERDFVLLCAFAVAFCASCCDGGIDVKLEHYSNGIAFTVSGNGINKEFSNGDDSDFWRHLMKLLSDSNLWDFSSRVTENRNLGFCLNMPYVKSGEEFAVRDILPLTALKVIGAIFGESLDTLPE